MQLGATPDLGGPAKADHAEGAPDKFQRGSRMRAKEAAALAQQLDHLAEKLANDADGAARFLQNSCTHMAELQRAKIQLHAYFPAATGGPKDEEESQAFESAKLKLAQDTADLAEISLSIAEEVEQFASQQASVVTATSPEIFRSRMATFSGRFQALRARMPATAAVTDEPAGERAGLPGSIAGSRIGVLAPMALTQTQIIPHAEGWARYGSNHARSSEQGQDLDQVN